MPSQPSSQLLHQRLRAEIYQARSRMGLLPKIGKISGSVLNKVSVAGGAFLVGFKIVGPALLPPKHVTLVMPDPQDFHNAQWVDQGQTIVDPAGVTEPLRAPEDGWVGWDAEGHNAVKHVVHHDGSMTDNPPCTTQDDPSGFPGFGGGWTTLKSDLSVIPIECGTIEGYWYAAFTPLLMNGVEDYVDQPFDGGELTCCHNPPANTSQLSALVEDQLLEHPEDYPTLTQWYAHQFDPLTEPDPLDPAVAVPDCTGLALNVCVAAIQTAGFGVHISEASFESADPLPSGQPLQVLSTTPAGGSVVPLSTEVEVTHNPDDPGMPRLVPAPGAHESLQAYEARLADLGLVSAPVANTAETGDPARGPLEVTATAPAAGTRAHLEDTVSVHHNPAGWPSPGPGPGGGGACDVPSIRAFELGALSVPLGNVFPFGFFGWMSDVLSAWLATPAAPHWTLPFGVGDRLSLDIDLSVVEPAMAVVRPVLLIVSVLGVVWMLVASAIRIRGDIGE